MEIICGHKVFQIPKKLVARSPLLTTMATTPFPVMDRKHGIMTLSVDAKAFKEYLKYLRGSSFRIGPKLQEVFRFMGHHVPRCKSISLVRAILRDQWIRENMDEFMASPKHHQSLISENHTITREMIPSDKYLVGIAALTCHRYHNFDVDIGHLPSVRTPDCYANLDQFSYSLSKEHQDGDPFLESGPWKSPIELLYNHPASMGCIMELKYDTLYMTREANYYLSSRRRLDKWMNKAWIAYRQHYGLKPTVTHRYLDSLIDFDECPDDWPIIEITIYRA